MNTITVTLAPGYTKELLHKGWGPHVPRTKLLLSVHTKSEGRWRAGEPSKLQGAGSFGSLKNHSTKAQGLAISLTKELTYTQHSQSVLRAKDMNTKLLGGLEMFLGVFVTSLNSRKL